VISRISNVIMVGKSSELKNIEIALVTVLISIMVTNAQIIFLAIVKFIFAKILDLSMFIS